MKIKASASVSYGETELEIDDAELEGMTKVEMDDYIEQKVWEWAQENLNLVWEVKR